MKLDHFINRSATLLEQISEWSGKIVAWLTLLLVIVTLDVVVLRYLFNIGWIALQESITFLHAMIFLLGAAYTLKHDEHVRVDIFYRDMSARKKAWVNLFGTLLLLFPVCLFIAFVSWEYVANSWALLESSQEAGGLPGVYLLKSFILVMTAMLILQGIALILRAIQTLQTSKGASAHE